MFGSELPISSCKRNGTTSAFGCTSNKAPLLPKYENCPHCTGNKVGNVGTRASNTGSSPSWSAMYLRLHAYPPCLFHTRAQKYTFIKIKTEERSLPENGDTHSNRQEIIVAFKEQIEALSDNNDDNGLFLVKCMADFHHVLPKWTRTPWRTEISYIL